MSSVSRNTKVKHDTSNTQNSDVMTPNEKRQIVLRYSKNGDSNNDDDDDDVLGKAEHLTNHISYTSILASTGISKQGHNQAVLSREDLTPNDVILGRGGNDKGPFAEALKDWWPQYEAGTHSSKRIICRDAIKDMHKRGVRFINRIENGSRTGYYTIEPRGSARVERKVIRSLRQEVLNFTVRSQIIKEAELVSVVAPLPSIEAELVPVVAPLPSTAKPVKGKRSSKTKAPKKARAVKTKGKRKVKPSNLAKTKIQKQGKRVVSYCVHAKSKYIPILPASLRPQENIKIIVPPPLRPSDELPPTVLKMNTSLGSVSGTNRVPYLPLIPSAINFGTSDLTGKALGNKDELVTQPQVVAASPDTVLASDYLSFLNSSFGMGMMQQAKELMHTQSVQQPSLQSTASFDFKGIFDDAAVDNVMNDIDATVCPPVLAGRQSSMFSAVSFKDWSQNQKDNDSSAMYQVKTYPYSESSRAIPAIVPDVHGTHDDVPFNLNYTTPFDRNTIFDEGLMPASPTAMYYNITNEVENFVHGTMPYITPQDKGYDQERRHVKTPTRSNAKRSISDEFEAADASAYHELCHKLEDSMAKLEDEEMQHKSWETHNEGLWRHFIQEQPDLAKMLLSRNGRSTNSYESPGPTTTVQLPPRPTNRYGGGSSGNSSSMTFDSRNTSPVPWWFYHDNTASDNSCSGHQSVSMKWQQLFASESEEHWEEV